MHGRTAQIISNVGLVYEGSFVMAWIALFSASLILGGVSACPAAGTYRWCRALRQVSRRGRVGKQPSVVYPAHPWVVCGREFSCLAGHGAVCC
jgi:hypothetical protein